MLVRKFSFTREVTSNVVNIFHVFFYFVFFFCNLVKIFCCCCCGFSLVIECLWEYQLNSIRVLFSSVFAGQSAQHQKKSIPEILGLVLSNPTKVKYFDFTSYSFISLLKLTPSGKFSELTVIHNLFIVLMYQTILKVTVVYSPQWHCFLGSLSISALFCPFFLDGGENV